MLQTLVKHAGREGPHVSFSFDKLLNLFAYDFSQCTSLNCIVCMRVAEYGAQNDFFEDFHCNCALSCSVHDVFVFTIYK